MKESLCKYVKDLELFDSLMKKDDDLKEQDIKNFMKYYIWEDKNLIMIQDLDLEIPKTSPLISNLKK